MLVIGRTSISGSHGFSLWFINEVINWQWSRQWGWQWSQHWGWHWSRHPGNEGEPGFCSTWTPSSKDRWRAAGCGLNIYIWCGLMIVFDLAWKLYLTPEYNVWWGLKKNIFDVSCGGSDMWMWIWWIYPYYIYKDMVGVDILMMSMTCFTSVKMSRIGCLSLVAG